LGLERTGFTFLRSVVEQPEKLLSLQERPEKLLSLQERPEKLLSLQERLEISHDFLEQVIRDVSDAVFSSGKFVTRQLHGGQPTKLLIPEDAILFLKTMPLGISPAILKGMCKIIEHSMNQERRDTAPEPVVDSNDSVMVGFKRRREELELIKMEHEINTMIIENKAKEQNLILQASAELERFRDPLRHNLDERTRLMMQDSLQNYILNSASTTCLKKAITDGPSPNKPISIGSIAKELGYNPNSSDAKRIGLDLRKRYIKQHGKPPPKHDQLCDGRVTQVNSYNEQDRPLVEEALHAYFKPCENSDGEDTE